MELEYKVELLPEAIKDLKQIDKLIAQRILDKIKWLSKNFAYITPKPLTSEFKNYYKLRVGDWRVIYKTDLLKRILIITMIGHRKDIYR